MDNYFLNVKPEEYCCVKIEEAFTYYRFLEYDFRFDEYNLCQEYSSYKGYAWARISYCPYCGKKLESLRSLYFEKQHYYVEEKGWRSEEFDHYWGLYRKEASESEAEETVLLERE